MADVIPLRPGMAGVDRAARQGRPRRRHHAASQFTVEQALSILIDALKAVPISARQDLAHDMSILARAPNCPETPSRVLGALSLVGR